MNLSGAYSVAADLHVHVSGPDAFLQLGDERIVEACIRVEPRPGRVELIFRLWPVAACDDA